MGYGDKCHKGSGRMGARNVSKSERWLCGFSGGVSTVKKWEGDMYAWG